MVKVELLKQKGHNFLWIDDYLMMWDIPIEKEIQKRIADQSFGNVLIGGYGLGMVQRFLSENPNVKSILTLEKHIEVIEECKKVYNKTYGDFEICDFYDYNSKRRFDCVIGDIVRDLVPEELNEYRKFKEKAQKLLKKDGKIFAWGKDFFEYLLK